jgi:hypothetical protein
MDSPLDFLDPAVHDEKARVLGRMRSGALPPGPAQELFGGHGTGAHYCGCDRIIFADQIEFEIHAGAASAALTMHSHCMRIWYDEWSTNLR